VLAAVVGVIAVASIKAYRHHAPAATSTTSLPPSQPQPAPAKFWVDPQYVTRYQASLDTYLATRPGKSAVAVVDLTTGASLSTDADTVYRAASVNKLELLIDLYHRASQHQIDLDATTVIGADDIQHYGTGTIQLQGPGQVYSWRELARLMAQESDNTASFVMGRRLGLESVQADLESWGLKQTSLDANTTTAHDAVLLLAKLQRRELLPETETRELLDLLQHTAWTDRLQSGVPAWLPVAHKIGTDVDVYNDAALFLDAQHPYAVVALGAGSTEDQALLTMTRISQIAFQFEGGLTAVTRPLR
jgi:beta-lactamase class A